ncbi:Fe-S cluster assembly protein SufD [Tumebacillus sp. BK434]|uniref:SufB/SufD family protein n=1 Tax=Tumebacillus sp. BK434 TaxID=2512169 RepID=UPI0010534881|nr:SufD family Fe-S cluster assembly protein [Tumebacillus sp. BK434]TCP55681.1 Fe-S cluster assembly protein SufD [Tumebacillus sp. BK434]
MTAESAEQQRVLQLHAKKLEPDWMRDLRLAALNQYAGLPDPAPKRQAAPGRPAGFFHADKAPAPCPDLSEPETLFLKNGRNRLCYANGRIVVHHLEAKLAKAGVLLVDLSLAIRVYPQLVRPYLATLIPPSEHKWAAWQTAVWNAGLFLYVPKNIRLKVPLQAWWNRTKAGGTLHPRVLVVAEENSDVTLLTGDVSQLEEAAFSVSITEVFAKAGARVRLASIGEHDAAMTRRTFARARVERDARVEWLLVEGSQGEHSADIKSLLSGAGASTQLDVVALSHASQRLDLTLTAHHIAPHTASIIRERAVVTGQAHSGTRVISQIEQGAVGTNAIQEARMILLEPSARAEALPMLLIDEEDVRCDHAVSVGKLPAEPLFYLMSRGLSEREAKRLLLTGFLSPLAPDMSELLELWVERKVAP